MLLTLETTTDGSEDQPARPPASSTTETTLSPSMTRMTISDFHPRWLQRNRVRTAKLILHSTVWVPACRSAYGQPVRSGRAVEPRRSPFVVRHGVSGLATRSVPRGLVLGMLTSRYIRRRKGTVMAENVYKVIELVGTSEQSWEKAASAAVTKAAGSLRDLRVAEVVELDLQLEEGQVKAYRAKVKVSFKYEGGD